MSSKYVPVNQGFKEPKPKPDKSRQKSKSKDFGTPVKTGNGGVLKDIVRVEELGDVEDYIDKIISLSSAGHTQTSIGYLLGVSEVVWNDYFIDNEDEITAAISEGKIIAEIEAMEWLRAGSRACGNFSALKYYGEMRFGWGGNTTNKELPSGIVFEMIEVEDEEDEQLQEDWSVEENA